MKLWKISGRNLMDLYLFAESMDEALGKARKVHINYNTCQVV